MITNILRLVLLSVMSLIILPLGLAEVLRLIGNGNKQFLVNHYGIWSQNTLGGLGVVVHELSHLIIALIFGHRIRSLKDIKLLDLHRPQQGKSMGYINHYYRKDSIYQSLGNFFIGIAPCFGSSLMLLLVHYLFWGSNSFNFSGAFNLHSVITIAFQNLNHPLGTFGWHWIIFVILIVMISCTGYGLSSQDWHGTMLGLPYWIVVVLVVDGGAILSHFSILYIHTLWMFILILVTFLGWGIVYSLITFITLYLVSKILNFVK